MLCFLGEPECIPMPSAVALTYTRDGFVIAADGRARTNGEILSETTQKIFPIDGLGLCYALCGRAAFDTKNKENEIDLLKDAPYAITAISANDHSDLSGYAGSFSMYLYSLLKKAQESGQLETLPTKETDRHGDTHDIFHLFVAGYFREQPAWCFTTFSHKNQLLLEPTTHDYIPQKGPVVYGPTEVLRLIFKTTDARVAAYRVKGFQESRQPSLSDGIEAMKNYVRACCDPEIRTLDPMCAGVGGRIHVATITPNEGFSWVCPPKTE